MKRKVLNKHRLSLSLSCRVNLWVFLSLTTSYWLLATAPARAYTNNMYAGVVIGQENFTSNSSNMGGSTSGASLSNPLGVFSDGTRLLISDSGNNRILLFNKIPDKNRATADVVIGQPDFTSNTANNGGRSASTLSLNSIVTTAIIAQGKLITNDYTNDRVLIWNSIPTQNGAPADVVIGQTDMSSANSYIRT